MRNLLHNSEKSKEWCIMKRNVYYRGTPGKKYGIWNVTQKCFQFNICEDTPMLAEARLYQKIGDDARKWRFEPRMLPDSKEPV